MNRLVLSIPKIHLPGGEGELAVKVDEEIVQNGKAIAEISLDEKISLFHLPFCGGEMRVRCVSRSRTVIFCPTCGLRLKPSPQVRSLGDLVKYLEMQE